MASSVWHSVHDFCRISFAAPAGRSCAFVGEVESNRKLRAEIVWNLEG
jgi:hypothetical protein